MTLCNTHFVLDDMKKGRKDIYISYIDVCMLRENKGGCMKENKKSFKVLPQIIPHKH